MIASTVPLASQTGLPAMDRHGGPEARKLELPAISTPRPDAGETAVELRLHEAEKQLVSPRLDSWKHKEVRVRSNMVNRLSGKFYTDFQREKMKSRTLRLRPAPRTYASRHQRQVSPRSKCGSSIFQQSSKKKASNPTSLPGFGLSFKDDSAVERHLNEDLVHLDLRCDWI